MNKRLIIWLLTPIITLTLTSCMLRSYTIPTDDTPDVKPLAGYGTLDRAPFREAWYGMYFKKEKIGYSHFQIRPFKDKYLISINSMMRLTALGKTSIFRTKEEVIVNPDLSLVSFKSASRMNGKDLRSSGKFENGRVAMNIDLDGDSFPREFPVSAKKIYHTSAVSLMPAMKGLNSPAKYTIAVFDPEKKGVRPVEQEVSEVLGGAGPKGAVWKVRHSYGGEKVTSWLNAKGLPVLEDGPVFTVLEDKRTAEAFESSTKPGKDLVLDYSLIKVSKSIPNPQKLKRLKIHMSGVESSLIPRDHRQTVSEGRIAMSNAGVIGRLGGFLVDSIISGWSALAGGHNVSHRNEKDGKSTKPEKGFQISVAVESLDGHKNERSASSSQRDEKYMEKSFSGEKKRKESQRKAGKSNAGKSNPTNKKYGKKRIATDTRDLIDNASNTNGQKEIIRQAGKIIAAGDSDLTKIKKLVDWTATNIKNKMRDSFSAVDVLRAKEGECQSHSNLYAALARACNIPTRVVTGLVYVKDMGFLYHAWAESYVNGWIAVDPTFNQTPADATHIKISTGDSAEDFRTLMKMVGAVQIEVLDYM